MQVIIFLVFLLSFQAHAEEIHNCWFSKGLQGNEGFYYPDFMLCFDQGGQVESASMEPQAQQKRITRGEYELYGDLIYFLELSYYTACDDETLITEPAIATFTIQQDVLTLNFLATEDFPEFTQRLRKASDHEVIKFSQMPEGCH
ncbi:MAG: hypothetical protein KDD40_02155 [Bdellovibrionales bacterium]|nr:hypothetical protein [Bdellovibrionales bacterium]